MIAVLTLLVFFSPASKTILSTFRWNAESGRLMSSEIPSRSLYSLMGGSPRRPASESPNVKIPVPIGCKLGQVIGGANHYLQCAARILGSLLYDLVQAPLQSHWQHQRGRKSPPYLGGGPVSTELTVGAEIERYRRSTMSAFALSSSIKSELSMSP